ncbi:hypothetical protein F3J34_15215 [Klebsiella sp. Ap-873]|nr:hypothetical protein [Klebsiella sp. Ap-873]
MRKVILTLALAMVLTSCASVGSNFDEGQIGNIRKGITTEHEVISYFGKPMSESVDSEGNKVLVWSYSHANAFGSATGKTLMVQLSNDKVKNYTVSKTTL